MDNDELAEIERQTVEVVWEAGRILLSRFRQPLKVDWKGGREGTDPVTEVDREVEAFVREELARRFPSHALVGEEGAGAEGKPEPWTWVVDPLDGTTNFINGLPAFACSIALLERGIPVVGAIFVPWPATEGAIVLHARSGGGTCVGDQALTLSGDPTLPGRLVVLPRGPFRLRAPPNHGSDQRRSVGSIAYELAATALGTYRFVLFGSPKVWDVAAGVLLVKEAGGAVVTLPKGSKSWEPFDAFALDDHPGVDEPESQMPGQEQLRNWTRPILAGAVSAVEQTATRIVPYRPLLPRALRMVHRALRPRAKRRKTTGQA